MRKRSFWRVLLVLIIGLSLGGCASMEEWCGHKAEKEQIVATQRPPEVVQPTPPPPAAKPVPPKKDRN